MPLEYPLPEDVPPLALGPVPDRFPSGSRVRRSDQKGADPHERERYQ
jgi:hypothetical protein